MDCQIDFMLQSKAQQYLHLKGASYYIPWKLIGHLFVNALPDIPLQLPFYRCRIPMHACDVLAPLPSRGSPESRNIVLMLRDWCYAVEVLDNTETPVSASKIESCIWKAIHDANLRQRRGEKAVPIGVLTAHDRNSWAKVLV
jgi:Choline/Carnitine o-acyltransferase